MADSRALMAVAEAAIGLLRNGHRHDEIDHPLDFAVYTSRNFEQPMETGVSLFVYRVHANGVHRTPPGRLAADQQRQQTQLPLEMHFILTVWAGAASLQHHIAGWMMRTFEDTPVLPAGVLNSFATGAFRPDETVEICLAELRTEDLMRIWETLGPRVYHLSVPYLARIIRIESAQLQGGETAPPAQQRVQRMALLGTG